MMKEIHQSVICVECVGGNQMRVNPIFEDFDDESKHYFIAKDIAEHIDLAIDEIKALKGCFSITGAEVIFKDDKVNINVLFLNEDNGKLYNWSFTNKYSLRYTNSVAKVVYSWMTVWKDTIQNGFGDCVGFYF